MDNPRIDKFDRHAWRRGPRVCGIDMSSKSKSAQSTTTTTTDARVVADTGAIGFSGSSGNTIQVSGVDSETMGSAFEFLGGVDAQTTDRANSVLTVAENTARAIIDAGSKAGAASVESATNVLSTFERAKDIPKLDNSTIIAALIGAGALILTMRGGK